MILLVASQVYNTRFIILRVLSRYISVLEHEEPLSTQDRREALKQWLNDHSALAHLCKEDVQTRHATLRKNYMREGDRLRHIGSQSLAGRLMPLIQKIMPDINAEVSICCGPMGPYVSLRVTLSALFTSVSDIHWLKLLVGYISGILSIFTLPKIIAQLSYTDQNTSQNRVYLKVHTLILRFGVNQK